MKYLFISRETRFTGFFKVLPVFILILFNAGLSAQSNKRVEDLLLEAKKQFSGKDYSVTIKTCKQILGIEPENKDAHLVLADVYEKLDSVNLEIIHLNKAGEIGREWEVVFRLGEAYFKKGEYSEALRYYNIYSEYKYIPEKKQFLMACKMASCKFAMYSINNQGDFKPQVSGNEINAGTGEFWPTVSPDGRKLVFARVLSDNGGKQKDEFYMSLPDSLEWQIARPSNDTILMNNEGIQKYSDSIKVLFFSACNRPDSKGDCDIYLVKYENGKWGNPINAGNIVNSEKWDAQPSFSPETHLLYFSSSRNGGKGNKDLWKAELLGFKDDGLPQWKEPVNLGSLVNTGGNEISPFVYAGKHSLYFASDGHPGMGGMDLFSTQMDELGGLLNLNNLGYPINTNYDDDALTLSNICDTVYFSSARHTEKGLEIFAFNLDRGLATTPIAYVKTIAINTKTKKPMQALIKMENQPFKNVRQQEQHTDENGEAMFCVQLNRNYAFTVSEPGYLYASQFLNIGKMNSIDKPDILSIEIHPIEIGSEVQLYNIYFETDSFRILPQSERELQNLVAFMKNNNAIKIEIQGHTDSSGNAENNKILSEQRAKSVVDYMVQNEIAKSRLKFGGYGDKVPIASNETPEGRMLNRRTTIKILEK